MIKTKPKDISPDDLSNQEIKDNLEEFRQGCIRIILAYDGLKSQTEICHSLQSWINDWIMGIGVPMLLTTGKADCYEKENRYLISFLIDSRDLLCLGESDYDNRRVNWSYQIGSSELREYKLNQVIN
jgi:hypothetical protein